MRTTVTNARQLERSGRRRHDLLLLWLGRVQKLGPRCEYIKELLVLYLNSAKRRDRAIQILINHRRSATRRYIIHIRVRNGRIGGRIVDLRAYIVVGAVELVEKALSLAKIEHVDERVRLGNAVATTAATAHAIGENGVGADGRHSLARGVSLMLSCHGLHGLRGLLCRVVARRNGREIDDTCCRRRNYLRSNGREWRERHTFGNTNN